MNERLKKLQRMMDDGVLGVALDALVGGHLEPAGVR